MPVEGAAALTAPLHRAGVLIRFATNNSMATRATYVQRLAEMGIEAQLDEIVTSTSATIDHLRAHLARGRARARRSAPRGCSTSSAAAGYGDDSCRRAAVGAGYDGGPLAVAY